MVMTVGQWTFLSATALLLLFAVLSNSLVIYCVFKIRKLRSVTNILICNLAVSDILLAGFVLPQRLHDISHEEHYNEGLFLCKVINFTPLFSITCSVYTLVCISVERRRAIIDSQGGQVTISMLYKIIPALWIFSCAVGMPTLFEYNLSAMGGDLLNNTANISVDLFCGSQDIPPVYSITNAIFLTVTSYIIPVVLMLYNYLQLAIYILRTGNAMTNSNGNDSSAMRRARARMRVVKLLIAVAVIFTLSWLPYFVMLPYAKITDQDASHDASGFVNLFLIALATFSTAYNVVLYVLFNPSFSGAIKELFCPKRFETDEQRLQVSNQGNSNAAKYEADNAAYIPETSSQNNQ